MMRTMSAAAVYRYAVVAVIFLAAAGVLFAMWRAYYAS